MPDTRKDLPVSKRAHGESLDFTEEELKNEWAELFATLPPPLGEGEAYAAMLAEQWGLDHKTVLAQLKAWEKEGKVEYVGKRRAGRGRIVDAYKVCKTLGKS